MSQIEKGIMKKIIRLQVGQDIQMAITVLEEELYTISSYLVTEHLKTMRKALSKISDFKCVSYIHSWTKF